MRRTILVLFLCTSSMAICQSIRQSSADSAKYIVEPGSRFSNLSQNWFTRPTTPVQTDPGGSSAWNTPQRNWKINPQQPWSLPGGQQFGKILMARNEHPEPAVAGFDPRAHPYPVAQCESGTDSHPVAKLQAAADRNPDRLAGDAAGSRPRRIEVNRTMKSQDPWSW